MKLRDSYKIGLSVFAAATIFIGCGGGGSSSSSSTQTDISVERGAVYNSVVTDANGQIAQQDNGKNTYTVRAGTKKLVDALLFSNKPN